MGKVIVNVFTSLTLLLAVAAYVAPLWRVVSTEVSGSTKMAGWGIYLGWMSLGDFNEQLLELLKNNDPVEEDDMFVWLQIAAGITLSLTVFNVACGCMGLVRLLTMGVVFCGLSSGASWMIYLFSDAVDAARQACENSRSLCEDNTFSYTYGIDIGVLSLSITETVYGFGFLGSCAVTFFNIITLLLLPGMKSE